MKATTHAVTGAFGFSGSYIARRLLDRGHEVMTLTGSPYRQSPLQGIVRPFPFDFDSPDRLARTLAGVDVLYNTYWVRFNYRGMFSYDDAVKNTLALFKAARNAGVRRVVHVSITNPSTDSHLRYFSGKAELEEALKASGMSYAILRPAVLFGHGSILINNIAWFLRRFPVFTVLGDGQYSLQPIYVDDLAALAVEQGSSDDNTTIDAIGPETFSFIGLVRHIKDSLDLSRAIIRTPHEIVYLMTMLTGLFVHDRILTHDEVEGLMENLLCVDSPPAGSTRLSDWISDNHDSIGMEYFSELKRRKDRLCAY